MHTFWSGFYFVFQLLLILAGIGLFVVIVYLAVTVLHLKNTVVNNAKRLYQPPVNSVKNITTTVKGIAQQEQVRMKHIAGNARSAASSVKDASSDLKAATQNMHSEDVKSAFAQAQTGFRFISSILKTMHAAHQQSE